MKKNKALLCDAAFRAVKALNVVLMTLPFALSWYLYYAQRITAPFYARGNWLIVALFAVLYLLCARIYDALVVSFNQLSEMIYSQLLAALMSDGIMYLVILLLMRKVPFLLPLLIALASQLLVSSLWSWLANKWYYRIYPPRRSAIVYDVRPGMERLIEEYGLERKFKVIWTRQVSECLEDMEQLRELDTVFLSGIHSHDRNIILKYCIYHQVQVYVIPRVGDVIMSGAKKIHMFHLPMMRVEYYKAVPEYLLIKRMFDIIFSLAAIVFLGPFMLIAALAVKVYDGGPVLYRQCRLTKDGKIFHVLKFRSMCVDAEKDGVARLSTGEKDDRVTPVGRILRKIRFDELPQLINILKGEMSIVGPRPERPEIAKQYEEEIPEFRLRLQVKAGLTGYAQVYGKYNTSPYDKLQMDLMYIATANVIEDLKICFATVKILISAESTEGIAENATTAGEIGDR